MPLQFADRLNNVETSAIRELFKLLGKPGIISFAGGFPDSAMFDVAGIQEAANKALAEEPGAALQYGATEGYNPLREQLAAFMASKGVKGLQPDGLIVTTGSQQALDLLGKTLINPGDKVIVEGPTFLATIQCFRLYGAEVITAPIDGEGVRTDTLEALMAEHKPKFVYLIPTFGNPSGALLSLERRQRVLELAVKYQTLVVEDDPYGDLYFGEAPPPSIYALSDSVPGSRELLSPLRQHVQSAVPRPARGLDDGPAQAAGQRHHVQAVQRRAHQHLCPGHRRPVPESRPHARHPGQRAQGVRRARPRDGRRPAPRAGRRH
jgi:2-aminoadipate transaminase